MPVPVFLFKALYYSDTILDQQSYQPQVVCTR
jgi:hypothetical protein